MFIVHNYNDVSNLTAFQEADTFVACLMKGVYDLLEAIPSVLKIVPDAHFYLGGDGDIEAGSKIIVDNGLSSSVEYIGWVSGDKKDEMLRKCSVFTLPLYHEGMPMSLLEAMSYGDVVVTTNVAE